MRIDRSISVALALLLLCVGAEASSSKWHHVDGASVRLVTSGVPDKYGNLRGALEIRLKPGWKTYWRDPGDSGVPPTLDLAANQEIQGIEIGFPAPQRFDDGYSLWAGYDHSVALTVTFSVTGDKTPSRLDTNAFLGVCETICIPVQAALSVEPEAEAQNPEHAAIVAAAFAALPEDAVEDFNAETVEADTDAIIVEATIPEGAGPVELFVAGTETFTLGAPERIDSGGAVRFRVPVLNRPEGGQEAEAHYTLLTAAGAVAGTLTLR